jgi:hypothetical protein
MKTMKKYFLQRSSCQSAATISSIQVQSYRELVIEAMKRMGATEQEISLLHEVTIKNSIMNKRKPEDVAWAVLQ